jgi:DNA-binding MarR family transcriptional regulator
VDAPGTSQPDADPVGQIDLAIFRLRRIWQKPTLNRQLRATQGDDTARIHLSNIFVVHAIARVAAECDTEITIGAVADRLDVDPSTASRLVGGAIDAGMVTRRASEADARRAQLTLTDEGRAVLAHAAKVRRDYIGGLMAEWPPEDRETFARLLTEFSSAAAVASENPAALSRMYQAAKRQ